MPRRRRWNLDVRDGGFGIRKWRPALREQP
jgi:hypothetical protein